MFQSVDEPYTYIHAVSVVSTLLSVYGLIVIYRASDRHMKHYHLRLKFFSLKLLILFANLQRGVFSFLAQRDIPECIGSRGSLVRADSK